MGKKIRYYKYPAKSIDVEKKESVEKKEKQTQNFALNMLGDKRYRYSEHHQYIKALIEEMNKRIKKKPVSQIAGVINFWLSKDYFAEKNLSVDIYRNLKHRIKRL